VLVVPIAPDTGGNGLAMRAGMLLEALASRWSVDLVLVPIAGPPRLGPWAALRVRKAAFVEPVEAGELLDHMTAQLADPFLRERLAASAPLPARVKTATPTLANRAVALLGEPAQRPRAVFVFRGYLAPLGCTLAHRLAAERIVVDLDDDDEAFERSAGAPEEADAIARTSRAWLPDADAVCAAAETDAEAMTARYGLRKVVTIPNAVHPPAGPPTQPPGQDRLLFVANFTYEPNLTAAAWLLDDVLPLVRAAHPQVTLELVGRHDGRLAPGPGVLVRGFVDDLEPHYHASDIAIAPLLHGSGTRVKVLEAFAYGRPVAATTVAIAGLAVADGREVLIGDSPAELARAIVTLLEDRGLAARIAMQARRTLDARYVHNVVAPLIRDLVAPGRRERPADVTNEPR
jgi:glycosyltransferase involved in cell wall biosynthesis